MRVVAAGLSFREAPLAVREAAAVGAQASRDLLRYLVGHCDVSGAAVLSTCNRTELYLDCADDVAAGITARIGQVLDPIGARGVSEHLNTRLDGAAIEHVLRVASGLESMVVGEAQVLGQLKDAHQFARETGTLSARLDFVLRRAISVAKLVHTHTQLGRQAGNLSEAAVDCAQAAVGSLEGSGVLLIGAGEVGELAAGHLAAGGARLLVTSRADSKERLAAAFEAAVIEPDRIVESSERFDVIIAATTSPDVVLDAQTVVAIQAARRGRPLCIVDLAVPRDVDPLAAAVAGVRLIDIDEVGQRARRVAPRPADAVSAAEQVIAVELSRTTRVLAQRDASAPAIAALTARAEQIRAREVERTLARLPDLGAEARERIEALSLSLVRKLLHGPVTHLRESADDPTAALLLREAFGLDDLEIEARRAEIGAGEERAGTRR